MIRLHSLALLWNKLAETAPSLRLRRQILLGQIQRVKLSGAAISDPGLLPRMFIGASLIFLGVFILISLHNLALSFAEPQSTPVALTTLIPSESNRGLGPEFAEEFKTEDNNSILPPSYSIFDKTATRSYLFQNLAIQVQWTSRFVAIGSVLFGILLLFFGAKLAWQNVKAGSLGSKPTLALHELERELRKVESFLERLAISPRGSVGRRDIKQTARRI